MIEISGALHCAVSRNRILIVERKTPNINIKSATVTTLKLGSWLCFVIDQQQNYKLTEKRRYTKHRADSQLISSLSSGTTHIKTTTVCSLYVLNGGTLNSPCHMRAVQLIHLVAGVASDRRTHGWTLGWKHGNSLNTRWCGHLASPANRCGCEPKFNEIFILMRHHN